MLSLSAAPHVSGSRLLCLLAASALTFADAFAAPHGGVYLPPSSGAEPPGPSGGSPPVSPPPPPPPAPGPTTGPSSGGSNPGPGDGVPGGVPGGPSSPGPSAPPPPGPSGGGSPGADTPRSPGGGGGGAPGGAPAPSPGSGPVRPPSSPVPLGLLGPDLDDWTLWWNLERDAFLGLRARVQSVDTVEDGKSRVTAAGRAPTDEIIEREVVPRLLQLVERERDDDVVTAALIALGRLDPPATGWPDALTARIHGGCVRHLSAANQEVRETAALTLGLIGEDRGITILTGLLANDAAGRKLSGGRVSTRTRAFAAYGLGLAGQRVRASERDEANKRQWITTALIAALEAPSEAAHDVPVAALIALGLCPLPRSTAAPNQALWDHPQLDHAHNVGAQLRYLDRWLSPGRIAPARVPRAHALIAAARLAARADDLHRARTIERLRKIALDIAESQEQRAAAALALGEVLHSGSGDDDARETIERQAVQGKTLERRSAWIALARAAGRPGPGDDPFSGVDGTRHLLMSQLARGRSGDRNWIAIALGVFEESLRTSGGESSATPARALADLVARERNAREVGAFATALALVSKGTPTARSAGDALAVALGRIEDPAARGHILVAAGMVGHGLDEAALRDSLAGVRYRPMLLWSTAVALGLVGDRRVTETLVALLSEARSLASRASLAGALGHIGDERAIQPLVAILDDSSMASGTIAFAVVALGIVCDRDPLPWRQPIAHALPYFATTATLLGDGNGVLDIF